jgi:hypothetical protein
MTSTVGVIRRVASSVIVIVVWMVVVVARALKSPHENGIRSEDMPSKPRVVVGLGRLGSVA